MSLQNSKINIAIDGWSACGKGTLAKSLAEKLNYLCIDSGAMYRAFTLQAIRNNILATDAEGVNNLIKNTQISFKNNPKTNSFEIYLNQENVETLIRSKVVNANVSHFSALSPVRRFLVEQQQIIASNKGVVMDGRDIGTVVLPKAELKIFMTAAPEIRAKRRFDELLSKNIQASLDEIAQNLKERDHIDSTREDSPLKKASDAKVLDNSYLSREEQLELALKWVDEVKNSLPS